MSFSDTSKHLQPAHSNGTVIEISRKEKVARGHDTIRETIWHRVEDVGKKLTRRVKNLRKIVITKDPFSKEFAKKKKKKPQTV
jgi:hypothetical protein